MTAAKFTFARKGEFWKDLESEVNSYLSAGIRKAGFRRLHHKAVFIIAWTVGSYLALLLVAHNWWQAAIFGVSLVLALDAAAFSIMHDGNHGGFSPDRRLNKVAGFTMEMLGGSSFNWKVKHNLAHHTYPNFDGLDDDIDQPPFARLASSQEWKWWYRLQHLYLWFAYGLMAFRWQTAGDVAIMIHRRIGPHKLAGLNRRVVTTFVLGKVLFIGWAVVLPLALHWSWDGFIAWAILYLSLNWLFSFVLAATFQMAHCNDEALFTSPQNADSTGKLPNDWAIHQVLATSDFCPNNRLITWYVGGLNYQLEHHLFPHVGHVHYPAIAKIVRQKCHEYDVPYLCQPTLRSALAAHYRHLRNMGQPPAKVGTSNA